MKIDPKLRYCMLVESPEKAKTINKIFKDVNIKNIFVFATIGHFTQLVDGAGYYNTGIHPEDNFKMDFKIDPAKRDVVEKLKEQVKAADMVIIASDCDREGEAIAWSCVKFLNIPKTKYKRVTYQAVNKKAILEGIENARDLDTNLINAAHARSALDKGFGYRISQLLRYNNKGRSGGRCQSAALMMVVDRDREIENFVPEKYFDLYLHFKKNGTEFKAKYYGTASKPIKRLDTQEQIDKIFKECKGHPFVIEDIEHKDRFDNPRPPFSTVTFQKECASKLGLTIKQAAECAQKLFESGKISYHRTDSEVFEEEFTNELKQFVKENFDKKYVSGTVVKGKADPNAQEGHEALHVLDLNLTPELYAKQAGSELLSKVYKIIYNRTVAAALKPAIIAQTTYSILNNKKHKFVLNSNELKFDGYKRVYSYKDDSDEKEEIIRETFNKGEELKDCSFESLPKETTPPSRYKEASFVEELKKAGIGRPSTYPTIVETIKSESRGYCVIENKCLKSTDLGKANIDFLTANFDDIVNLNYTKQMENSLDLIAQGKLDYLQFLKDFFGNLESSVKTIKSDEETCPLCGSRLAKRQGKFGPFLGCTNYPSCKYTKKL